MTVQMEAIEHYFPVVLFIFLWRCGSCFTFPNLAVPRSELITALRRHLHAVIQ